MKDLGKTIAKYRKEHKLNQSQLAKELENYDIYVKQNSISAWELGTATPNARQFLALCEILEIMISIRILSVRVLLIHSGT